MSVSSFSPRARAQLVLAVTSGLAACHNQPPPAPTAAATSAALPTAPSQSAASPAGLVCPDHGTAERMCVKPRTPPTTGEKGHMQDDSFSAYDANGCYAASALVGTCSGVAAATGPVSTGGKCCYDVCHVPVPCGRPIVVDGAARLAALTTRADWSGAPLGLSAPASVRERAAEAWQEDARLEHASVAAFARLSLELMAIGAPSELVEAAHRAALQEIEHTRTCFAIAAALSPGSAPQGPARLPLADLRLRSDLREIALEAAAESCVGETVAALALTRAAGACTSEELRARLLRMADEELSHAVLGARIVSWAFAQLDESARDQVRAALRVPTYDAPRFADESDATAWREVGRLTSTDLREVENEARALMADVVRTLAPVS